MLRKSVETRDCLSAVEPRTVRAVMKRVVEDVAAMDVLISQLYEEGVRAERTSDSTRRSYSFAAIGRQGTAAAAGPARSTWSITPRYHVVQSRIAMQTQHQFSLYVILLLTFWLTSTVGTLFFFSCVCTYPLNIPVVNLIAYLLSVF